VHGKLVYGKALVLGAYVNALGRDLWIEEAPTCLGILRKISTALYVPSADNTLQLNVIIG